MRVSKPECPVRGSETRMKLGGLLLRRFLDDLLDGLLSGLLSDGLLASCRLYCLSHSFYLPLGSSNQLELCKHEQIPEVCRRRSLKSRAKTRLLTASCDFKVAIFLIFPTFALVGWTLKRDLSQRAGRLEPVFARVRITLSRSRSNFSGSAHARLQIERGLKIRHPLIENF